MKLLLDVGNSYLKWAQLAADGGVAQPGRIGHRDQDMEEVLDDNLGSMTPPEAVWVASVAGDVVRTQLEDWIQGSWGCPVDFLQPVAEACGVRNAYAEPTQLGADRWAALLAARAMAKTAAVVVDCGTAVTVDALDGEGVHQGGLILPGLETMRRSLVADTAAIGEGASASRALLGRTTQDALAAGTLYALVAAIDRISGDLVDALGGQPRRILTGGDAAAIMPLLAGAWDHQPLLVLQGLAVAAASPGG